MRSFFIICALVWATFASAQEAHVCEMAWENLTSDVWEGGWLDPHALDSQGCAQLRYLSRAVYARHGYHEDIEELYAALDDIQVAFGNRVEGARIYPNMLRHLSP